MTGRIWYAVERIADLDGNDLPEPVRKGVFVSREIAREYLAGHHGPYPSAAFRTAEIEQKSAEAEIPVAELERHNGSAEAELAEAEL